MAKLLRIVCLALAAIGSAVWLSWSRQSAPVLSADQIASSSVCDCERRLEQPLPVEVQGQVIASLVGGQDAGLLAETPINDYQYFYLLGGGDYAQLVDRTIKASGRLVGTTCAYANSLFHGCAAEIEVLQLNSE